MHDESKDILSILIKEEKIELFSKVKEKIIELPNNSKEETKELQSKGKENIVLQIVKEETLDLPKIENDHDKIYQKQFNKFIYFRWIAKSIVLVVGKSAKVMGQCKFPRAQA
jgi:hypothetical protein